MSCNQGNFAYWTQAVSGGSAGTFNSAVSSPYLIVSNNPETISSISGPITLYKGEIPLAEGRRFRFFFWHINNSGSTVTFGFRAHLDAGTASMTSINRDVQVAPFTDLSVQGICEAKAHLLGTLDSVSGSVSLSTTSALAWSQSVSDSTTNGSIAACVMEFDVTSLSGGASTLYVRTFVTDSSDQGSYSDTVATSDGKPRGWWPRSSIKLRLIPTNVRFDCDPARQNQDPVHTEICGDNGPEHGENGFVKLSGTEHLHDITNKGCYGVDLVYFCEIENKSQTEASECHVSLRSRNTGSKYWGAAKATQPSSLNGKGIRKIPYKTGQQSQLNAVNPFEDMTDGLIPIGIQEDKTVEIKLANGGGATLPCQITLSAPSRIIDEEQDPDTE